MLRDWQGRIQDLWVRSPRNRIIIMISTGVVAILVLCGLCNMIGSLMSGVVTSALASNPGPKPTTGGTSQVNNFNPTFPLPSPTTYPVPNQGATPVGSSGTPAPSPTKDPRATPTDQPTQPGGGGKNTVTFTLSPSQDGKSFVAGQTNQINLQGQPDQLVSVSVYAVPACVSMNIKLDNQGQATLNCDVPANLKNSTTPMQIQVFGGKTEQFNTIAIT
jgi:hypothetical protein